MLNDKTKQPKRKLKCSYLEIRFRRVVKIKIAKSNITYCFVKITGFRYLKNFSSWSKLKFKSENSRNL
ncbi:hypothetical protein BpHYR1_053398 [Brachionus plicatilis]|uniref:Uncharacterized protein n=1 Tax=Brachionus plicatilis TaxID=10195 RepID=A0A3M7QX32_BRAPC|nr:hypothetical protein BpHYR1_053398 [Brachionus plicatilis]